MVTSFVIPSSFYLAQRSKLWLKAVSVTLCKATTLFPPSSSINNDRIILSVICDYTMTSFKLILFHPSRLFKCTYSSSAARKQSYIMLLRLSCNTSSFLAILFQLNLINMPGRKQFLSSSAQTNMTIKCLNFIFKALSHTVWRLSSISNLCITPTCHMDTWIRFLFQCTKLSYLQLVAFYH